MNRRKSDNSDSQPVDQADGHPVDQADSQPAAQADGQPAAQADSQMAGQAIYYEAPAISELRPSRRAKSKQQPPEPLQLDPQFVNNPQRMQYALLLALLLRQKTGSATFSQRDMAHQDTDYNILFARTLDGKSLEVTVVSSESGIIRSPAKEMEAEKWRTDQADLERMMMAFQPLPPPSMSSSTNSESAGSADPLRGPRTGWNLAGGPQKGTADSPVQFQPGASPPGGFAIPPSETHQTAQVIQLPNPEPTATADGSTSYHFPFQVGENPQSAQGVTMNLDRVHQQLLAKDQEVATQEAEAIARLERGE